MKKSANISKYEKYRFSLCRIWDKDKPMVNFIGVNPSTVDANKDDSTIAKSRGYANRWGFGGIIMTNLFAYRAPKPENMKKVSDAVGKENDSYLIKALEECAKIILAWGGNGAHMGRNKEVINLLSKHKDLHCLVKIGEGHSGHSLYEKADLTPQLFIKKS